MRINVTISWDEEARVWTAVADDIGLVLESGSVDALIEKVKTAAPELIEMNIPQTKEASLLFSIEREEKVAC
jgi:hypothetical protein